MTRSACRRANRWVDLLLRASAGVLLFAALLCGLGSPAGADSCDRSVRIMTQNIYQGADFSRLIVAQTPEEFRAAVTTIYEHILATKPDERARAIAREIQREHPDIIALQELAIVRTGRTAPVTTVVVDQLQSLLTELNRSGLHYETIAIIPDLDVQAPTNLNFQLRLTERDVIIARTDAGAIKLSNLQVQHYWPNLVRQTPLGPLFPPIVSQRGWTSIDVKVHGLTFRFATTHLHLPMPPSLQVGQAEELLKTAGSTDMPVVFAGDFNARADHPSDATFETYQKLVGAHFVDAWKEAHLSEPGYTCCQEADLLNPSSMLDRRIDLVLFRGPFTAGEVRLVGNQRLPSGLWPSDHAGVLAKLSF